MTPAVVLLTPTTMRVTLFFVWLPRELDAKKINTIGRNRFFRSFLQTLFVASAKTDDLFYNQTPTPNPTQQLGSAATKKAGLVTGSSNR